MPQEHREALRAGGVFTAKHLQAVSLDEVEAMGIPRDRANHYLQIASFVQLPRCGPTYAQILIAVGYKKPEELADVPSRVIASKLAVWIRANNMDTAPPTPTLTYQWVEAARALG